MRTVHLLRKYEPAQWGGTETAMQRLFAGLREHGVGVRRLLPEHQT